MPSNHLILCRPLLLLPSIFPTIRVFSNESVLHIRWPKYWSFSFSIQWIFNTSNEYSGLTSFRMDWFDLLAAQGTLKSSPIPQFKSINSSVFSFLYSPTLTYIYDYWKNHSFDFIWTFVGKVMSLLFNMLSRVVIAFLSRSRHLLISWLQSPSAVILEPPKKKSVTLPMFSCIFVMKWWDQMPWSKFSECWFLSKLFHSPLLLLLRGFQFLFTFCHKDGVICISEVIDISPSNHDSSVWFIQSGISHGVLCI